MAQDLNKVDTTLTIEGSKTANVKTKKMKLSGSTKIDISSPKIDSN